MTLNMWELVGLQYNNSSLLDVVAEMSMDGSTVLTSVIHANEPSLGDIHLYIDTIVDADKTRNNLIVTITQNHLYLVLNASV